jgi:hypothetical protein
MKLVIIQFSLAFYCSFAELSFFNELTGFQTLYGNVYMFSTQIKYPFYNVTGKN